MDNQKSVKNPELKIGNGKSFWAYAIIGVMALAIFFFISGRWVVATYMERIYSCGSAGTEKICFALLADEGGTKRVSLKNMDPDKKYRLVIKQKVGENEVEVGTVTFNPGAKCVDTDGGRKYMQKGVVEWEVQNFRGEDKCLNDTTLEEYYCESDNYKTEQYRCPHSCVNGACWEPGTAVSDCTDPDGKNYYTQGHTLWPTQGFDEYDKCLADGFTLQEGYCADGGAMTENVACRVGCASGACKKGAHGESCLGEGGCEPDYFCKPSGRYGYNEMYCCNLTECAAVANTPPTLTGVDRCIGNGETEDAHSSDPANYSKVKCEDGKFKLVDALCMEKGEWSTVKDDNCCAGAILKPGLDPNFQIYGCCEASECFTGSSATLTCVPSGGASGRGGVEYEKYLKICDNGTWETTY